MEEKLYLGSQPQGRDANTDKDIQSQGWIEIGAQYRRQNRWDMAIYYYYLALEAASLCNDLSTAAECTYCIGVAYLLNDRTQDALAFLEISLQLHQQLSNLQRENDITEKLELIRSRHVPSGGSALAELDTTRFVTAEQKSSYSVLLLGVGQQGRAALFHLANSPHVAHIIAIDSNLSQAQSYANQFGGGKTECLGVDVHDRATLSSIMRSGIAVVIDVLPKRMRSYVAPLAMQHGVHLVNTFRDDGDIQMLHLQACKQGVTIIPGVTIGPTIKQMICRLAIQQMDQVDELYAYAGGFPELVTADNPLKYKFTWTPNDYLLSYQQSARILKDHQWIELTGPARCSAEMLAPIDVGELGRLIASPAGNFMDYIIQLHLESGICSGGSYILNWPGHYELMRDMMELGLFGDQPISVGQSKVIPRDLLREVLANRLKYLPDERDITFMRAVAIGMKDHRVIHSMYDLLDYGDLSTGFLSQSRVVGFAASIVAQMIAMQEITERGVLSAVRAVNPQRFFDALSQSGIQIIARESN